MRKVFFVFFILITVFLLSGAGGSQRAAPSVQPTSFAEALESARGKTVTFYGWGGDQAVNRWKDVVLGESLRERYNVTLRRVPMDAGDFVSKLMAERQAGLMSGDIDLVWINGENFYAAKNAGLLWGPITHLVENFDRYIGADDLDARYDFGTPIDGMEVPFGKAQLVFIADSAVLSRFPASTQELMELARQNPGRLTYPAPPDFVGSAFIRNIIYDIVGFDALFNAPTNEQAIYQVIRPALDYLVALKPFLWQQGQTYPTSNTALDTMYVDGQVLMTMNYTPLYAAQRIAAGHFPPTSRTFLFERGNIGNTHYVAIPFNAPNKDAALVLINHIISPEMQIEKYDVSNWGDLPVFDVNRLSPAQRNLLDNIDNGIGILSPAELQARRVPEVQAAKIPIIDRLWQTHVLGAR